MAALRPSEASGLAGPVPDRGELSAAVEPLGGALLVDVADEPPVDAVAHQLLQLRWVAARHLGRHAELLVLLLTDEARAIVHGDPCPPQGGPVRAAAVPKRSIPHEQAPLAHFGGDGG